MSVPTVQQHLSGTYYFFVGQKLEINSVAADVDAAIRQHTVEFSDATGKYPGDIGYNSSHVQAQIGFPVIYSSPGVGVSDIYRYGSFLTTGAFKVRSKVTLAVTDTGWVSTPDLLVNVLPKGVFPSSVVPNPDQGSDATVKARFTSSQFDDGYEQRVTTGLNNIAEMYNAKWAKLDLPVAEALLHFFEAHGGVEWFYWTAPNALKRKKWKVSNWKRTDEAGAKVSVSATLEQVFDLS